MWGGNQGRAPPSVKYVPPKGAPYRAVQQPEIISPAAAAAVPPPVVATIPAAAATNTVAPPSVVAPVAPQERKHKLWTVGYGGMDGSASFVELLKKNDIHFLWDIRRAHISYQHGLEMGNVFKAADNDFDAPARLSLYEELVQLAGELLTRRLREIVESGKRNVAIMCACGKPKDCHRNVIATYLEKHYNYQIVHINNTMKRCG